MLIQQTPVNDVVIIEPKVYSDSRGFFLEVFQEERYRGLLGDDLYFVQDNHSRSYKHVLRGMHFQRNKPQGKLVRIIRGAVFDVVVDLRRKSSTFGQWFGLELSEDNKKQLWVPPGFAHGFLVLTESAEFEYKCTRYYDPADEVCLLWNDSDISIEWPIDATPILSDKDRAGLPFRDVCSGLL